MLELTSHKTPAYWPRVDPRSVVHSEDRLEVAYTVWKERDPVGPIPPENERLTLLFLHGSQCSKEIWHYFVEMSFQEWGTKLAACVLVDAVNAGDSAILNDGKVGFYTGWDDCGRDAAKVLENARTRHEIPDAGPIIVLGHSSGGSNALCLAAFDPALVTAAVVFDPVYGGMQLDNGPMNAVAVSLGAAVLRRARSEFNSAEEYGEFISTRFITAKWHPRVKADAAKGLVIKNGSKLRMKQAPEHQAGCYFSVSSITGVAPTLWRSIRAPVLVVHGDIDDWNPPGSSEELAQALRNGSDALVSNGGHLVFFEKPVETFMAYKDFITRQFEAALARNALHRYGGNQREELDAEFVRQKNALSKL